MVFGAKKNFPFKRVFFLTIHFSEGGSFRGFGGLVVFFSVFWGVVVNVLPGEKGGWSTPKICPRFLSFSFSFYKLFFGFMFLVGILVIRGSGFFFVCFINGGF